MALRRPPRWLWWLILAAALGLLTFGLRSGKLKYCPGDPCLFSWLSPYCAYLCPYTDPGPVIGIPARER